MPETEPCCPYAQAFTRIAIVAGIAGFILALWLSRSDANSSAPTQVQEPGKPTVVNEN